jgi:ABC-type uncharacterized transport system permease subunit
LDRGGDGGGQLRTLNNEWINPTWSCHAETLPLFGSSWKRIRISAGQFANYLAGYAGGYASFKSGDIFYAAAVQGVGGCFSALNAMVGMKGADSFSMRWNGMMDGIMDALDN